MDNESYDSGQQVDELLERIQDLREKCYRRSAMRVTRELRRLAKAERLLIPYLEANFYLMNDAQSTYEADLGVELAIDTIALLESEEKARQFQPNFPEAEYWETVFWMSACAYDNLATHFAHRDGHNAEGVHAGINDGIEVCRRTGKLQCINCFREYATDVFRAGGDLDMAMHHARTVAGTPPHDETNDRRWVGAHDIAKLLLLRGQVDEAEKAAVTAWQLADTFHSPLSARLSTRGTLAEILALQGRDDRLASILAEAGGESLPEYPPQDESPDFDLDRVKLDGLKACCRGEHEVAFDMLAQWDRRLEKLNCLSEWLEVRLRMVAALRLADKPERMHALARQLESRAKAAHDWLTLSRLKVVLDESGRPSPLASLAWREPASSAATGIAAGRPSTASDTVQSEQENDTVQGGEVAPETPLAPMIQTLIDRLREAEDQEQASAVLDEILQVPPAEITVGEDAGRLVYLAGIAARMTDRSVEAWRWAEPLEKQFPQHATTINVVAHLGASARSLAEDDAGAIVSQGRLESMFRASLDLDHEHPRNFARAGSFHLDIGNTGEAERCFARGFKLERTNPMIALNLAEIYAESDRMRDALAVLDMCLREGCDDPDVVWQAGLSALQLERYPAMLNYLNRFEEVRPGELWTQYYRALALLETGRPEEALAAVETEQERHGKELVHTQILKACAQAGLGRTELFQEQLANVLNFRLAEADYLTITGLARLFEKLHEAAACLSPDVPERAELDKRALESGMAPDGLFETERKKGAVVEELNYYSCEVEQPLDDRWPDWPGCLVGQSAWTSYQAMWGVLAPDEDEAARLVLDRQRKCFPLEPKLVECDLEDDGFRDAPGVVWQGARRPTTDED